MIDLHTHTFFSDGVLVPSELVRRAEEKGYTFIGITDHVDESNIEMVVPAVVEASRYINRYSKVKVIPGCEITHVHPERIGSLVVRARELGARVVVLHGETITEPVYPGTNRAGIMAGVDILAHPGLIKREDVRLARQRGVYLEITARKGACLTNGYVARLSSQIGARMVFSTDTHSPEDLLTDTERDRILLGAGLDKRAVKRIVQDMGRLVKRL